MRFSLILIGCIFLGLLNGGVARADVSPKIVKAAAVPQIGVSAPNVTLKTLQGKPVTLADYRGKVVLLNFWATWCPPCRAEMPSMERLNRIFQSTDFALLAVNVEPDGEQTVPAFLKRWPHSFPVLLDVEAKAQNTYQVFRFPETFIISREGVILNHVIGARDWDDADIVEYLRFLLEG